MVKAVEFITEIRAGGWRWLKSYLPKWPDYVLKDWLYTAFKGEMDPEDHPDPPGLVKLILNGEGLSPDTQWKLIPDFEFTLDKLHPYTRKEILSREGGKKVSHDIPRDAERHATQAKISAAQGGISREPVIGKITPQGFELLEGWHRTVQHFQRYPNGYKGPAWVAKSSRSTMLR